MLINFSNKIRCVCLLIFLKPESSAASSQVGSVASLDLDSTLPSEKKKSKKKKVKKKQERKRFHSMIARIWLFLTLFNFLNTYISIWNNQIVRQMNENKEKFENSWNIIYINYKKQLYGSCDQKGETKR